MLLCECPAGMASFVPAEDEPTPDPGADRQEMSLRPH